MRRKVQQKTVSFRLRPLASAVMLSVIAQAAYAGPGKGVSTYPDGRMADTFYAHSPSGVRPDPALLVANNGVWNKVSNPGINTGKALRKFVDPLPGLCADGSFPVPKQPTNQYAGMTGKCIPVAKADKASYPGSDYYEIGVVEYEEFMHADLKKKTRLRGYVQLNHPTVPATKDANGNYVSWPTPHYLGPIIATARGTPVRVKFVNLLPAGQGTSVVDPNTGKTTFLGSRNGDLFLPVDRTLMGAGLGPDGATMFLQNRAEIHLHGGDTPWISDGTPHQWIAPKADEIALKAAGMKEFARGASTQNVPDMPDPGPGAVTYYFPNNQSARLMFYHDHTAGLTRVNVYAGEAAGYIISDPQEAAMVASGAIPNAASTLPLIIQEKTFVPDDIALQDARWNTAAWGQPGDLWFPHVYELNQDPMSGDGTNPVGRWDWGPYFWPVFPSLYNLPSGEYGDVTTTPEAFLDTPLVNGTAYPYLTVDPKAYRFRVLNATNDRFLNLGLYVADKDQCSGSTPGTTGNRCSTEVNLVPFEAAQANFPTTGGIMGTGWGQPDGRAGGVPNPDPKWIGPNIIQIGTEGGFLPAPVDIPSTPVNFEYGRRSITVLGINEHGLLMGAAERADIIVDFSKYAGKTLILYNDAPAPVPAYDPRIDFHVDKLNPAPYDDYLSGGAMPTQVGFGPNTRTIMQIRVANKTPAAAFNMVKLQTELPQAYAASQEKPIVPQMAYNAAWPGIATVDQYAKIATGTLQQPTFDFDIANAEGFLAGVELLTSGSGYIKPPKVTVGALGEPGVGAEVNAVLKIDKISIIDPGTGYVNAPVVSINTLVPPGSISPAPGSGATGVAFMKITGQQVISGGTGYTNPTVTIGAPEGWYHNGSVDTLTVKRAKATANIGANGQISSLTFTDPGAGYTVMPQVFISDPTGSGASIQLLGGVDRVELTSPTPGRLDLAGGRGYTDMSLVSVNLRGIGVNGAPLVTPARAAATGTVAAVTVAKPGTGYGPNPTITIDPPVGAVPLDVIPATATAKATPATKGRLAIHNKAIQELFEPNYGRMNATLGIEMPFTSAMVQTTIPLAYIDPATEMLKDGETQIWKITHNGVDTHPVHFHLANLQLVNRIGWDGTIKPPKANELGWKETIAMNPLEDVVVAVRAKRPTTAGGAITWDPLTKKQTALPGKGFGLPRSERLMDPTQPRYAMTGFTQIDAATGNPAVVYNDIANYNWEYVWHCHILGHEENDFMRPMVFDPNDAAPAAPGITNDPLSVLSTVAALNWIDNAETEFKYEIFVTKNGGAKTLIGTALANAGSFNVAALTATSGAGEVWTFTVEAVGANGRGAHTVTFSNPAAPL